MHKLISLFNPARIFMPCIAAFFLMSSAGFAQAPAIKNANALDVQTTILKGQVIIKFGLPKNEFTTVKLFTAIGAEVSTMVNRTLNAGDHEFALGKLPKGFYFLRVYTSTNKTATRLLQIVN